MPPKMFPVNTNSSVSRGTHFYKNPVTFILPLSGTLLAALKAEKLRLCPHYAE